MTIEPFAYIVYIRMVLRYVRRKQSFEAPGAGFESFLSIRFSFGIEF